VNYGLVGGFVLALSALLIGAALWLASGGVWQTRYDTYLAIEDESVAGLNLNAPVRLNGVAVGKVRSITLDPSNPDRVRLLFAIERGTPIKTDTVAVLKTQGLTGIAYVELGGGSREAPLLQAGAAGDYPTIRTKPSLSARLDNVLTTVLAKLDHTSANIDAILSDANRAAFTSAMADIATVARTVAGHQDEIARGLRDAARTADNSARATAEIAARTGPLLDRIGRSADAVEKLGSAGAAASRQAGDAAQAVGGELRRFTDDALPELERLLGELTDLSTSLRRLSEQARRSTGGVLLGRSLVPDGPGEGPNAAPANEPVPVPSRAPPGGPLP
jgi:phospholipid/cholesterol/gamma-HCH transport system substrate-binding protein